MVYIYIDCTNDIIKITQDNNGSYGIYLYQDSNFFAVSNSFLYLANNLKKKKKLSLNIDYVKYFLHEGLVSRLSEETMINEIKRLSRDTIIFINKNKQQIFFEKSNLKTNSIKIDTKEGMMCLDEWFQYYRNIIANIIDLKKTIITDLSGGYDSRTAFSLFAIEPELLKYISVNTNTGRGHTLEEDYKIATKISDIFNFKLNKKNNSFVYPVPSEVSLANSFFTKLSFHSQFLCKRTYCKEKIFHFTGAGGEKIRNYWKMTPREHILQIINTRQFLPEYWKKDVYNFVDKSFRKIMETYNINDNDWEKFSENLYFNNRSPMHFGKTSIEGFLAGELYISPLIDSRLELLDHHIDNNVDRTLLTAIILSRYVPQLLNIEFDNNKKIDISILKIANILNNKFPFTKNYTKNKIEIIDQTTIFPEKINLLQKPRDLLFNIFCDKKNYSTITSIIGYKAYNAALFDKKNIVYFGDSLACQELSVSIVNKICQYSILSQMSPSDIDLYYSDQAVDICKSIMDVLKTSVIDLILRDCSHEESFLLNCNKDNTLTKIYIPGWLKNLPKRFGYSIISRELSLNININILKNGELLVRLRSKEINENNIQSPFKIDYKKLLINNEIIFNSTITASLLSPFTYVKKVNKGDRINIYVEWLPHGYSLKDFERLINCIKTMIDI